MKIVILDAYTMNPGDLSWAQLEKLGDLAVYERTAPEQVLERAADAEIILSNKTILNAETIASLEKLKYIGILATGYNVVDIDAASKRNIPITNVPAYSTDSVAQIVFAHILNLTQHLAEHAQGVREGRWSNSPDFCYWDYPQIELIGLIIGIIGFGRIGKAVAKLAEAFGMNVIIAKSLTNTLPPPRYTKRIELEDLFRTSDIISLHCTLSSQTEGFINKQRLTLMKKSAYLINTGRGGLIDEQALADALNTGTIAAAGLDVLSTEPPHPDNPLLKAKNCYITPHIAWSGRAARQRLLNVVVENIKAFLSNNPQNVINNIRL